jgi:hypothetical protein
MDVTYLVHVYNNKGTSSDALGRQLYVQYQFAAMPLYLVQVVQNAQDQRPYWCVLEYWSTTLLQCHCASSGRTLTFHKIMGCHSVVFPFSVKASQSHHTNGENSARIHPWYGEHDVPSTQGLYYWYWTNTPHKDHQSVTLSQPLSWGYFILHSLMYGRLHDYHYSSSKD